MGAALGLELLATRHQCVRLKAARENPAAF